MRDVDPGDVFGWALIATVVVAVAALLAFMGAVALADGKPTGCYIQAGGWRTFSLMQAIPWREDRTVGVFVTFAEATGAAEQVGCKLSQ